MGITIIDSFNGIFITNDWFSISQPYKFSLLLLMLLRLLINGRPNKYSILLLFAFLSFFTGYFIYFLSNLNISLLIQNLVESTKYFIWPISFIYFRMLYMQNKEKLIKYVLFAFKVSYFVVILNIFLGILGFGYDFYPRYNTGTKGFFFSGNEFSLLFILLTYIMAWKLYHNRKSKYILFCLFSLFLSFQIGSKTAILGVFILILVIGISHTKINLLRVSVKKIIVIFFSILSVCMAGWFFIMTNKAYINDFILKRLEGYNYELITWFLSKRNLVAADGYRIFKEWNFSHRLFGKGEASFQQSFRMVELDYIDLLMNHGYVGLTLYLAFIISIFTFLYRNKSPFNKFMCYTYILLIFVLANMSGHIINTGITGFFMGMVFAMPYFGKDFLIKPRHYGTDG